MSDEEKYNEDSDDQNVDGKHNNDELYSMNSGIDASKFRKRLSQLQHQSEKLQNLTFQLLSIKNADFITQLSPICAIGIIQETKTKNKKKKIKNNDKMVLKLFVNNDTERVFNAINGSFEDIAYSLYKDSKEANTTSLIQSYQMIETPYSLFCKSLNNKAIIILMTGQHTKEQIASYRLLDILQTIIVDLCTSLKVNNNDKIKENDLSMIAMTEILNEVFGGNGDEIYPLDQTEFVTCLRVRIGMETIWGKNTKQKLEKIFEEIIESTENVQYYEENDEECPCLKFEDFINYFSPRIGHYHQQSEEDKMKGLNDWNDVKKAVNDSPLSKRNRRQREKENISASKYRDRLNVIEKLINLLEEALIFQESKDKMVENEKLFWRKKLLIHREFVRFYQDIILCEVINENDKMKKKMDKLLKINKFNKKIKDSENEWFKKNEHLLQIEQSYYVLLKKQKKQQNAMKECEKMIKNKDAEIVSLKLRLKQMMNDHQNNNISVQRSIGNERDEKMAMNEAKIVNMSDGALNKKLVTLRDEIATKKAAIQQQLNSMTRQMNNNRRDSDNIKHDRI